MKQTRAEKVTAALGGILDAFKSGKVAEAIAVSTIQGSDADIPSGKWSLSNRVLQFLAGTSDARGYRQWERSAVRSARERMASRFSRRVFGHARIRPRAKRNHGSRDS